MGARNPFPITSRYAAVEVTEVTLPDGRRVSCLRRRFVPDPARFATYGHHVVSQGERLDRITWQALGDPLQFWRIADANGVLHPDDLVREQRVVRITLPEGLPGVPGMGGGPRA